MTIDQRNKLQLLERRLNRLFKIRVEILSSLTMTLDMDIDETEDIKTLSNEISAIIDTKLETIKNEIGKL